MRGRPPKKTLTPEQERAASAFVEAAEAPTSGSGRADTAAASPAPEPVATPEPLAADAEDASGERVPGHRRPSPDRPWEDDRVRDDVVKGYALRLPEPLYLKLKWVAEQTGRSMNAVCRDAVETEVEAFLNRP